MGHRAALFICGVVTLLTGRVFNGLEHSWPTTEITWSWYSYVLLGVGAIAVCISLLPATWLQALTGKHVEVRQATAFRSLLSFAAFGLILAVALNFVPSSFPLSIRVVYMLCPACGITITVDSSLAMNLFVLAPLNALIFGAIGGLIGTAYGMATRERLRNRRLHFISERDDVKANRKQSKLER